MARRRVTRMGASLAAVLLVSSCTTHVSGHGGPHPSATATSSCPASYLPPDPARPQVSLNFVVSADHGTVSGTEHLTFTPDLPIRELVFRLTANTRPTVASGTKIALRSARA